MPALPRSADDRHGYGEDCPVHAELSEVREGISDWVRRTEETAEVSEEVLIVSPSWCCVRIARFELWSLIEYGTRRVRIDKAGRKEGPDR
jgi:hypothetical protein